MEADDQELVEIDEEDVPLAVMDEEDAGDEEELDTIEDEETPLASMAVAEGVRHYFQHILEVGGAGLLPAIFAASNRKKKKEVNELKEQLGDKK